ncbi:DUF4269 domain-containing protein [Methylobacterium brachythecii]|uniref:Alpha/beta hydrolase n=1 Tax=Methylobacterium brachythecii TaxID=1176177 RepID=A0A7W6AKJ3_9HYPH|nr:DUF4269 domain-containing protein [Methylobacterium brachythecii]MBB3902864.1 hypothetical protein [Methylobacterium brachythecii]GLS43790.1 alpha/beta hydrolase [Methylobacterium brachythecii]
MEERLGWEEALARSGLMETLARFDPRVVGTLPLGVAMPDSYIDVLAYAPDLHAISAVLLDQHGQEGGFFVRQWTTRGRPVVAGFVAHGWAFEVFASAEPVATQPGWLHFAVEQRLLELAGDAFRDMVMQGRSRGLKTEPAFAKALGLKSDPYSTMLRLSGEADSCLEAALAAAGFSLREREPITPWTSRSICPL